MHAIIESTPSGTILRDLGSGNGTYIGDRRILEYRLSPGDVINIGAVALTYHCDTEAGPAPGRTTVHRGSEPSVVRFQQDADSTVAASSVESVYKTFIEASRVTEDLEELREAQARLAAVYNANQIMSDERNLEKLFRRVMDQIFALVPAHNGVIMLANEETGEPVTAHVKSGAGQDEVVISSQIVARAFRNGEAVFTPDAKLDPNYDPNRSIITGNITSVMCVPLTYQDETLGVIYVDTRGTANAFDQSDIELLVALAGPASIAIKNAQYLAQLQTSYEDTLRVVARTIEMRDHYTVGHTWRVTNFALVIARELGWSEERLKNCEMGGVLHDVGKIAVDDAILRKPSGLTDDERAKMQIHPERGAEMMRDARLLAPLTPFALYHHERWDGNGYPFGLEGEDIPIEGRIIAAADTLDAMTSNRPYRKGLDLKIAIAEIEKGRSTQFDPEIVDAVVRCHEKGLIERILQEYHKGGRSIACPFCSTFIKIPDGVEVGGEMTCNVCHRRLILRIENEALFGELVPGAAPSNRANRPTAVIGRPADE